MLIRIVSRTSARTPRTLVIIGLIFLIVACRQAPTEDGDESGNNAPPVTNTATNVPPIGDAEATELMYTISDGSAEEAQG